NAVAAASSFASIRGARISIMTYLFLGRGIGVECCGFGNGTARKSTGGDFQPIGVAGTCAVHSVDNVWPSTFFSSNTIPGWVFFLHSCHSAILTHSLIPAPPKQLTLQR